ncbi:MAG: hypothetical protein NZM38_04600 [Cytophagales bacterium]|nr:hypothetical protein [Cytophagales bacterium]MDW8384033.1 hypothetical protein [Flammeovirgaceae bacterium]
MFFENKSYLIFLFLFILIGGCSERQFNEKHEYALYVDRSRFYGDIERTIHRLEKKGLNAYPIAMFSQQEGRYFYAMMYAEKSLQTIMSKKIECEDKYKIKNVNIMNYKKEYKRILPLNDDMIQNYRKTRLRAPRPKFSKSTNIFLETIPYSPDVRIKKFIFVKISDEYLNKMSEYSFATNLPRGIQPHQILSKSEYFAELTVIDPLHKFHATYTIAWLKPQAFSKEINIASLYAEMILNQVPKGSLKEKIPLEVQADDKLVGYQINIQIVKDKQRAYLVLTDEEKNYLIFMQEESNNILAMTNWLSLTGDTEGALHYPEVQNTVYGVQDSIVNELVTWQIERLSNISGNYGLKMEGTIKADFIFRRPKKGWWEIDLYHLPDSNSLFYIFKEKYGENMQPNIVLDSARTDIKARLVFTKKKDTKEVSETADEIRVLHFPYIVIFSNKNKATLSIEELKEIAKHFQIYNGFKKPSDWLDWF